MNISNQELHSLNMAQVIIEDSIDDCNPWGKIGQSFTDEINRSTLESMYRVQDAIYTLFSECDRTETSANTINPAQQNIFIPLKQWVINCGGCFVEVSIHQRGLGSCFADMRII